MTALQTGSTVRAPVVPVFLEQVHGNACAQLLAQTPDAHDRMEFDAAVTTEPGVACTIMVADCLPVLITDRQGRAVAAAHAGWRGLAGGVLESTLKRFKALALSGTGSVAHLSIANDGLGAGSFEESNAAPEWLAWLGPCIGPAAFEVGDSVREVFCRREPEAQAHFISLGSGKYLADLAGLARQRLAAAGVSHVFGNDGSAQWCTFSNPSRFFSHRRDGLVSASGSVGGTGRMAACIWLDVRSQAGGGLAFAER